MSGQAIKPEDPDVSFLTRLAFTPISQLIRGQIAPLKSVPELIAAAKLPAPIAELMSQVVTKTKLWKREQVEVVRELVSHFKEGLEAGTAVESLVNDFGDRRVAARLIRRSKKRNRPLLHLVMVRAFQSVGAIIVLAIALYGISAIRVFSSSPTLRYNFTAEYNAKIEAIPQDKRAWPLYRAAALLHGPWFYEVPINAYPGSPDWEKAVQYTESHQDAIRMFRDASRRPNLGRLLTALPDRELRSLEPDQNQLWAPDTSGSDNPPLMWVRFPELSVLRRACGLLRGDAALAIEKGESSRFMNNAKSMLRMVEHAAEGRAIISDLVAMGLLSSTCDLIEYQLVHRPLLLNERDYVDLSHRLAGILDGATFRIHLDGERQFILDFLQRNYSDNGRGDGHLIQGNEFVVGMNGVFGVTPEQEVPWLLPVFACLDAGRKENLRKYDEIMDLTKQEFEVPLWLKSESKAERYLLEMNSNKFDRIRFMAISSLIPALSSANRVAELATQQRDATLTAIALELYKRKNGQYPESLAQLVPQFMPTMPLDRFDGQPIKYKIVDGRPLLYSVGADRRDDDGLLPEIKSGKKGDANRSAMNNAPPADKVAEAIRNKQIATGDWILWPPVE